MLHPGQALRSRHDLTQTLVVELVRNRARRAPVERGAHGDDVVLLGHILMDRVIGESRKGEASTGEEHLNGVSRREPVYPIENVAGLFSRQHSVADSQLLINPVLN
jgi:hypothetical protein